jgi:HlyD family secretion protein
MSESPSATAATPAKRHVPMPVRLIVGLIVIALIVGWAIQHFRGDGGVVRASGMIEMDETDVSSLVGGRVTRLFVDEGDAVRAGDTIAVLDRAELSGQVRAQLAEAQRAAAESRVVQVGPRTQEIQRSRADLAAAEAQLTLADHDLARAQKLVDQGVISQADYDRAKATRDSAAGRRNAARESLRLLEAGSRKEEITASKEAAAAALAQFSATQSQLNELVLVAPSGGVVLLKNFHPGELVQAGQPVVTLGDPDSLWMRVYVSATDIERVQLGAPVELHLSGISKNVYHGRVVEIASRAEFTPRAALTEEERANLVFGVKLALDRSGGVLKAGLPGDVRIAEVRQASHD